MGKTLDLGRRVEIHSMDPLCQDISLALYRKVFDSRPSFLVHSYHDSEAAAERMAFIRQTLITMLGMEAAGEANWLRFPCGGDHLRALKRSFLDLCKLETGAPLEPKSLTAFDRKAGCDLEAANLGEGKYEIKASSEDEQLIKRASAIARGFAKICEMEQFEDAPATVQFPCRHDHDEMIGMLTYRAQNARAAMKEEEQSAGRGVLAPPSQQ